MLWDFLARRLGLARHRRVPQPAEGETVYAVGDIHGRADLLLRLRVEIAQHRINAADRRATIVYLGDYIDRGPDPRGVIDILSGPPPEGVEQIFLRGNHEATFLEFLDRPAVFRDWRQWGGLTTLASYGVRGAPALGATDDDLTTIRDQLDKALPATHRAFLERTQRYYLTGDLLFVHAGLRPRRPLSAQDDSDLFWIRGPFLEFEGSHGHFVVHGHSSNYGIDKRPNRLGIDTGAYATGRLTCAVFGGPRVEFLSVQT